MLCSRFVIFFFFFFQAEDGIRDLTVTGVQTCALPISIATAAEGLSSGAADASAAKAASTSTGVRTFVVTTQIENRSGLLKPGMTGLAKVVGGDRRVVDLVMRRLGHTFKVEFWSWW